MKIKTILKNVSYTICCIILLSGCMNSDEKIYKDFFNQLDKNKTSITTKNESVYFDYDYNHFEYYISADNGEYLIYKRDYVDYLIAYHITKNSMISIPAGVKNTNAYCILYNEENSNVLNDIECKNSSDYPLLYSETTFLTMSLQHFFEDNGVTKQNLITSLRVYYKNNIKK